MKESIITAILSILSGLLLIGAVTGLLLRDRTAPVISLEGKNNLTYTEGEDFDVLLKDMTAEDEKDGDVTDSLRVSNIYVTSKNRAMVVYVAKDEANNIAKLKREVKYVQKKVVTEEVVEEQQETQVAAQTTVSTEATVTETAAQTAAPAETAQEAAGPRITLIQNEATLKVGETFSIYRYVQGAVDSEGNDISRSMHIEGAYDTNVAGVYQLQIYAWDANQIRTNVETFTLTVEP